jgi:LPS-assembly protein
MGGTLQGTAGLSRITIEFAGGRRGHRRARRLPRAGRRPYISTFVAVAAAFLLNLLCGVTAFAADAGSGGEAEEPPILFTADQLTHDRELGITTASGNVEIIRADRILLADTVTYNAPRDFITASGNIALVEPSGDVLFANYMELTGDLKTGAIESFRAILSDGTRMAAATGNRTDGNRTVMNKGVYSPCDLCPEDPMAPPIWQIKAVRVIHDQEDQTVEFRHAWLELAGVPIFYTPYLSQPDPTVKRKTGFLPPDFGISSDLGGVLQIPFFWAITPYSDLTLAPAFTTNEGPLLEGEYRHRLTRGELLFQGSITNDSTNTTRGHVFSNFRYDIDDTWRAGLDVNRASDRTYLRKYDFSDERTLTSRVFAEGFRGRNYLVANGYAFDTMDSDVNQDTLPYVFPMVDYNFVSRPDRFGGRATMDMNLAVLTRDEGNDTQRLSSRLGWEVPFFGPVGDLLTFSTALWTDGYHVSDLERSSGRSNYTGYSGRVFPQASLQWRLPFIRDSEFITQVIEPTVEFVAAPDWGNPEKIPNDDSQAFNFDESNVFGFKRFPGLDRVDQGTRVNYGVNWRLLGAGDATANVFVGQVYQFQTDDDVFSDSSGLGDNVSDFVGAIEISPKQYIDLSYRTRLNKDDLTARRNELGWRLGVDALNVVGNYVFFDEESSEDVDTREEINTALRAQLSRYWRTRVFGTRDLRSGTNRILGVGLTYEDECLEFGIEYSHRDFEDDDIEESDSVFFRIAFKTLGKVETGFKHRAGNFGG